MLGTIVNAAVVIVGSLLGTLLLRKTSGGGARIPPRFDETLKKGLGLATLFFGIKGSLENEHPMLLIASLVIGAALGELINLDGALRRAGDFVQSRMRLADGNFSKGFVNASIIFCAGAMTIVGSIEAGLRGNNDILFAKSILDGSTSIMLAASMGIGVMFSSLTILVYQGAITLLAGLLSAFLTPPMITEMSAIGSLLIAAIGLNFLEVKEIRVANLIPAVFVPCVYFSLTGLF
jgi:uncharacterized membrane protein YqgA involved in biofilm formation